MKRRFRLTSANDFKRVRRKGKSYAHPLVVLICHPNDNGPTRFGVSTSRNLRKAVQRNRARRLLREAIHVYSEDVASGWDVVLVGRSEILATDWSQILAAVEALLRRAKLLKD
jgi:ribonuclease P protein component